MADPPTMQPLPGFDWSKVKWGGPKDPQAEACSYCGAEFRENEFPFRLWTENGAACAFCEACQKEWWGITHLEGDEENG